MAHLNCDIYVEYDYEGTGILDHRGVLPHGLPNHQKVSIYATSPHHPGNYPGLHRDRNQWTTCRRISICIGGWAVCLPDHVPVSHLHAQQRYPYGVSVSYECQIVRFQKIIEVLAAAVDYLLLRADHDYDPHPDCWRFLQLVRVKLLQHHCHDNRFLRHIQCYSPSA